MNHMYAAHNPEQRPEKPQVPPPPFYDPSTIIQAEEDGDWEPVPESITAVLLALAFCVVLGLGWMIWRVL